MEKRLVLGADIGGTHITAALVDLTTRSILPETFVRAPVNAHGAAEDIISAWAAAIQESCGSLYTTATCISIAMPLRL